MSQEILKKLLKPPLAIIIGGEGTALPSVNICNGNDDIICTLNPIFCYAKDFILSAINEKLEHVFHTEEPLDKLHPYIHCPQCQYPIYKSDFDTDEDGQPLRWIKTRSLGVDWIDCPKCKHGLQEGTKDLNYCPFCGQRLGPPEGDVL